MIQTHNRAMSNYKQALDGAKAVVVNSDGYCDLIAVWHGGTTVNVYVPLSQLKPDLRKSGLRSVDAFARMDDEGRPVDRETIVEEMNEHLELLREEEREE